MQRGNVPPNSRCCNRRPHLVLSRALVRRGNSRYADGSNSLPYPHPPKLCTIVCWDVIDFLSQPGRAGKFGRQSGPLPPIKGKKQGFFGTRCSFVFQPALSIAEAGTSIERRPLHQRVWEVERQREHKLRLLQAEREEREGATFAPPPLGRVSERLARAARPEVAITGASRHGLARRADERRRQRLREYEAVRAVLLCVKSRAARCNRRSQTILFKLRCFDARFGSPYDEFHPLTKTKKMCAHVAVV